MFHISGPLKVFSLGFSLQIAHMNFVLQILESTDLCLGFFQISLVLQSKGLPPTHSTRHFPLIYSRRVLPFEEAQLCWSWVMVREELLFFLDQRAQALSSVPNHHHHPPSIKITFSGTQSQHPGKHQPQCYPPCGSGSCQETETTPVTVKRM